MSGRAKAKLKQLKLQERMKGRNYIRKQKYAGMAGQPISRTRANQKAQAHAGQKEEGQEDYTALSQDYSQPQSAAYRPSHEAIVHQIPLPVRQSPPQEQVQRFNVSHLDILDGAIYRLIIWGNANNSTEIESAGYSGAPIDLWNIFFNDGSRNHQTCRTLTEYERSTVIARDIDDIREIRALVKREANARGYVGSLDFL